MGLPAVAPIGVERQRSGVAPATSALAAAGRACRGHKLRSLKPSASVPQCKGFRGAMHRVQGRNVLGPYALPSHRAPHLRRPLGPIRRQAFGAVPQGQLLRRCICAACTSALPFPARQGSCGEGDCRQRELAQAVQGDATAPAQCVTRRGGSDGARLECLLQGGGVGVHVGD